ncbi:MAG: succinate dehydrogenase/fumarate reductase iron-sulfur subunit [Myxococcales bacterium]|nr:succinate dehydrogenase/fumarate reductase iron-sulfur subunit [Myxococcales bacterium]
MKLTLEVWRQTGPTTQGRFHTYEVDDVTPHMSMLDVLDLLNEQLVERSESPIAFDHDCREGICGSCGAMVDGIPHGPLSHTTLCQLHMRHYSDGDRIRLEPFRAAAFPVVRDLLVDRSALDRLIQSGGYISVRTGAAPEASTVPVPKDDAERAFDAATCIGCGACVAACPNASASLFTAAKITHLSTLPQGQPERQLRVLAMVQAMDDEGFGGCSNHGECAAVCPKGVDLATIAQLNRDHLMALLEP